MNDDIYDDENDVWLMTIITKGLMKTVFNLAEDDLLGNIGDGTTQIVLACCCVVTMPGVPILQFHGPWLMLKVFWVDEEMEMMVMVMMMTTMTV